MSIVPEGRPFVAVGLVTLAALAALGAWRGGWWWVAAAIWAPLAVWMPWFFRNPPREGPRGARLVIAPADGKVVSVVETDEPMFLKGRALRVSVFMNVLDVHVNRHPVDGTVTLREYRPGRFVNATRDKASAVNERTTLGITAARGPVLVQQIAGLIARRIVTDPRVGDRVRQGERLGLIRFGSRVDTYVPSSAHVLVRVGDRTTAGSTVIAEWLE